MKTLVRYIYETFLGNFLMATFGLTLMVIMGKIVGMISNDSYPIDQILILNLLEFPPHYVVLVPPGVLLATLLTFSTMNRQNELVACYSIGIGLRQIVALITMLTLLICFFTLVLQDRVLPLVNGEKILYYQRVMKGRKDFHFSASQGKIWYRSQNLIYNLESFEPAQQLIRGMWVYEFDQKFHLSKVTQARQAAYQGDKWVLQMGTETRFDPQEKFPITRPFEERDLLIKEKPKDFMELGERVSMLRIKQLYQYIQKLKATGANTRVFETNFHERISLSFISLLMVLLAVPFAVRRSRQGGMAIDLLLCLIVTVFYWLFRSVGLQLAHAGTVPPLVGAWMTTLIFGLVAAGFMVLKRPT